MQQRVTGLKNGRYVFNSTDTIRLGGIGTLTGNCDTILLESHLKEFSIGYDSTSVTSLHFVTGFFNYNSSTAYQAPQIQTIALPSTNPLVGLHGISEGAVINSLGLITYDWNCQPAVEN
jgi:hypothetical protein